MTENLTADDVIGILRKKFGDAPYFNSLIRRLIEDSFRRDPDFWLAKVTPAQASAVLGYSENTLRTWRANGKGPQCWFKEGTEQQSPVFYESRFALYEWDFVQRETKLGEAA